jgi:hypothetical protein
MPFSHGSFDGLPCRACPAPAVATNSVAATMATMKTSAIRRFIDPPQGSGFGTAAPYYGKHPNSCRRPDDSEYESSLVPATLVGEFFGGVARRSVDDAPSPAPHEVELGSSRIVGKDCLSVGVELPTRPRELGRVRFNSSALIAA